MRRDLISEDSNQFGPGTDLVICLLALLMVLVMIVSFLYGQKKTEVDKVKADIEKIQTEKEKAEARLSEFEGKGKFKLDVGRFDDTTFKQRPSKELTDPQKTEEQVLNIIEKYNELSQEYPFIFIIGHANEADKMGEEQIYEDRLLFNWAIAGERAAVIANLLQNHLSIDEKNKIIIVSTGEFDLKDPENPKSLENANVEVIFGREWKLE